MIVENVATAREFAWLLSSAAAVMFMVGIFTGVFTEMFLASLRGGYQLKSWHIPLIPPVEDIAQKLNNVIGYLSSVNDVGRFLLCLTEDEYIPEQFIKSVVEPALKYRAEQFKCEKSRELLSIEWSNK